MQVDEAGEQEITLAIHPASDFANGGDAAMLGGQAAMQHGFRQDETRIAENTHGSPAANDGMPCF
jgi:hypothetical protein